MDIEDEWAAETEANLQRLALTLARMQAKTTSERVEKLRQERLELGLKRREVYAHDEDWPKIQELAAKLQRKREAKRKA